MHRALVTGATGFAGRYLVEHLESLQYEVWRGSLSKPAGTDAKMRRLDVRDREAVRAVVDEVEPDEIYHLAAITHPASDAMSAFYEVNLQGTLHVLAAASRVDARVLVVGSAYAYGRQDLPIDEDRPLAPVNHYGASKAAADLAALPFALAGLHVVRARPFNHSGPGQPPDFLLPSLVRQVTRIRAGLEPPTVRLGNLESVRDFSDVRDIVPAYHVMLRNGAAGEAYNLASGVGTSVRDLAHTVFEVAGVDVAITVEASRVRSNDIPYLVGDAGKARRAFGWKPGLPLSQTIADMLDYEHSRLGS